MITIYKKFTTLTTFKIFTNLKVRCMLSIVRLSKNQKEGFSMRKRSTAQFSIKRLIDKNKQDIMKDTRHIDKIIEKIEERHIKTENR